MRDRYTRALRLTPPKMAAATAATSVDGYWLEGNAFYFLAERIEPSLGRMVSIPMIAECETSRVREVVPLETLARLLCEASGRVVDIEALSRAEFDMPNPGQLSVVVEGTEYRVSPTEQRVIQAKPVLDTPALYSPDGRYACFVKACNLGLKDRDTGEERSLTNDGEAHHAYGQPSETELSAIAYRRRPKPVGLWSPDSQWFLTHRIDEREVPDSALIQHAPPGGGRPLLHTFKYTIPGDPLPLATLIAIHADSGHTVVFKDFPMPVSNRSPLAIRRIWFGAHETAWCVHLNRYQNRVDLISLDLTSGSGRIVLSESMDTGYIDSHPTLFATPNVRVLSESNEVIWYSERDGRGHLYLHDVHTGALKNRITQGEWQVRDIVEVNKRRRKILFLAAGLEAEADPAHRSLCSVSFDGSDLTVLLGHDGDVFVPRTEPAGLDQDRPSRSSHTRAGISPDGRFAVVHYMSLDRGNRTEIVDLAARRGLVIASATPTADDVPPRHFTALAANGVTRLHGVMFLPAHFRESEKYPLIDCIYPGPQRTHQPQAFGSVMFSAQARALAELGFVTLVLDTRGMPVRSRAFHQIGYGHLLEPQLADHAAVIRQLAAQHPFIDADRVGIIGDSGGGAATARALFDYGDIFKVGVAACGNHDSNFYATIWSDKYRGPGLSFAEQANGAAAHKLQGRLLLIHGDMDENVHASHTLALADALIRSNKDFDLLIVPNAGHEVFMAHGYALRRAWDYLVTHLLGEAPPKGFEIGFDSHEIARFWKAVVRELRQ